jgi:serine phosphatase RsbU (regulator of sigma subunit)
MIDRDTMDLARLQARVAYQKDVLYRSWNMSRGPVYVPETPETPANPYLSDVPERSFKGPSGATFTMVNPAYMTRQVHELEAAQDGVRGHITSLRPIRPQNAADSWEADALRRVEQGANEVSAAQVIAGSEYMRLLRPLVTEEGCLKCHAVQGYRVGDIRGGISVSVPMAPLWAVAGRHRARIQLGHAAIWLVGIIGIRLSGRKLRRDRDLIDSRNAELAGRNVEINKAYAELDRELKAVGDVQKSLLPVTTLTISGFELSTHYRPARRAGGDYFNILALPDGDYGILVADVSGHGAPAAVVMAMTHVMLALTRRRIPAQTVLDYLNDALLKNILPGQFVTCCYGILNPERRTFTFSSAGHPAPLIYDPGSRRARVFASEPGYPLGLDAKSTYSSTSLALEPGTAIVLYTDGVTDAFDAEGKAYSLSRLVRMVEAHGADGAEKLRDAILLDFDAHRGSVEPADDTALVILRASKEPCRPALA